jgi:Uma2 family endonuclease
MLAEEEEAMYQIDPVRALQQPLPTMYDLPSEDPEEPGLPDEFHDFQPQLLRETFRPSTYRADAVFVGTDLNLYYDSRHTQWYKRPDWFAVLGVHRSNQIEEMRLSYVIWQEGVAPFLIVELLSPGTEAEDLGKTLRDVKQPPTKWEVYEQILRVPYYVVFERSTAQFRAFQLVGARYQELDLPDQRLWLEDVQLGLGIWQGQYQETFGHWLRCYDNDGNWIPATAERADELQQSIDQERQSIDQERQRADQERQRADQERQRADQERQRADQLAEQLRSLGINPDELV